MTPGPLDALRADPAATLVATDFDGTLSPIVDDPAAARAQPGAVEALDALAARYGGVAVISGRPVSFLESHLPDAVDLVGLYGLERRVGGVVAEEPGAGRWRDEVARAAALARDELPPEVEVESKGLSLTLHFRSDPANAGLVATVAERLATAVGLLVRPARMAVELHPPVHVDKGSALLELAVGRRAACFIGDDAGDLAAFDALDVLTDQGLTTVRVAVGSAEAPPVLLARADLVVDGPAAVVELLRSL